MSKSWLTGKHAKTRIVDLGLRQWFLGRSSPYTGQFRGGGAGRSLRGKPFLRRLAWMFVEVEALGR